MAKSVINVRILGDNKGLKGALDESEGKLREWAGSVGKVAAGAAAAAGALVAAGIAKGFADASSAEAGQDLIQGSLGIDEATAERIGAAASGAYRDAWGENLEAVQDTAASIFQSFGEDIDLRTLTSRAEALGQAFKIDVGAGVQTASELVSSGLAGSADEAFDLLTSGLQKMPVAIRDELLEASNEYGDFFADLGFSGEEAFGLLTGFAEDGVYGIDKAGDAVKEFGIRATDMSTASVGAFEAAGLNAEDMAERLLDGGEGAREAMDEVIAGLLSIEDPVEQANSAIALFGTPLEDLGVTEIPGFLEALGEMDSGLGDVEGAAQDMADTLGGNARTKIEAFKRQALGRLADFVADNVIPHVEKLGSAFLAAFSGDGVTSDGIVGVAERIGVAARQVVEWFRANWPQIQVVLQDYATYFREVLLPITLAVTRQVIQAVATVVGWFLENWPKIRDVVLQVVDWLQTNVVPVVESVMKGIIGFATEVVDWVRDNWPQIQSTIAEVVDWLATNVVPVVTEVMGFIIDEATAVVTWWKENWPEIQATIQNVFDAVMVIVEKAIDFVSDVITTTTEAIELVWSVFGDSLMEIIGDVWETIKDTVDAAINVVRGVIDTVTGLIEGDWDQVWNGIKTILDGVWEGIKETVDLALIAIEGFIDLSLDAISAVWTEIWDGVKGKIDDVWEGIEDGVEAGINAVVGFVSDLPGRIAGAVVGAFDGLYDAFAGAVNRIIRGWNGLEFSLPAIDTKIPGIGKIGGFSIGTPNIPTLHSGGVVPGSPGSEVLALLQAGEYVTSLPDVRLGQYGPDSDGQVLDVSVSPTFHVSVFVGDREIRDLVRVEVNEHDRDLVAGIRAGVR